MFDKILAKILKMTGYVLETKKDVIKATTFRLCETECGIIYNYVGEHNTTSQQIYEAVSQYYSLLQIIPNQSDRALSVKPSQFGSEFYLIERIAEQMAKKEGTLWIDAEDYYLSESQFVLAKRIASLYDPHFIGLTLQLKSNNCFSDAIKCFESGIKVRLCKGAYPNSMVNSCLLMTRAERIIKEDKKGLVEIATIRDMDLAMLAIEHKLPLQVLYGWHKKFLSYPYELKIYMPFGTNWWPYIKRRIKER